MTDIWLWIVDKSPIIGVLLLVAGLAVFVTYKVVNWRNAVNSKMENLDETLNSRIERMTESISSKMENLAEAIKRMPCEKHSGQIISQNDSLSGIRTSLDALSSRVDVVNQRADAMSVRIDAISDNLTDVSKWIMKFDPATIDMLVMKHSPRMMTAAGKQLYEISGARKAFEDNAEFFLEELGKINPQTPFDVEDKSLDVLMRNLSLPMFNPIKNYVYYQPDKVTLKNEAGADVTVSLSLMVIVQLMSLELRDRYLKEHPDIEGNNER